MDEPFVLALLLSPASQSVQPFRTDAFEEVEAGVSREINHRFERLRVPKGSAALVLPISVWESDDEGAKGRDKLLEEFAQKTEAETKSKATEFIDARVLLTTHTL